MIAGVGFSLLLHFSSVAQQIKPDAASQPKNSRPADQKVALQPGQTFLREALESNQAEIVMSRMAVEKAYAEYGNLSEAHQVAINQIKGLTGSKFDKHFIATQLKLHQEVLTMLEQGAKADQPGQIRQFAQRIMPQIRQHLQKATQLQATLPD